MSWLPPSATLHSETGCHARATYSQPEDTDLENLHVLQKPSSQIPKVPCTTLQNGETQSVDDARRIV
jgi:hypothetical protein